VGKFYPHVFNGDGFPDYGSVAFGHFGKPIFEVFKYLGAEKIGYNHPISVPYATENPF
jgi:hypothetical protein